MRFPDPSRKTMCFIKVKGSKRSGSLWSLSWLEESITLDVFGVLRVRSVSRFRAGRKSAKFHLLPYQFHISPFESTQLCFRTFSWFSAILSFGERRSFVNILPHPRNRIPLLSSSFNVVVVFREVLDGCLIYPRESSKASKIPKFESSTDVDVLISTDFNFSEIRCPHFVLTNFGVENVDRDTAF